MIKIFKDKTIIFVTITIYLLFTVIGFLGTFILYQSRLRDITIENSYKQNVIDASNIKNYIETSFDAYKNILNGVSHTIESPENMTLVQKNDFFSHLFSENTYLLSLEILDEDKEVIYTYPASKNTLGYDRSYEVDKYDLTTDESYVWTKPYISPHDPEPLMSLIVYHSNYYYIGNFSLYFIDEIYAKIHEANPYKQIMIHDLYGIFVYDSYSDRELHRIRCEKFDDLKSNYLGKAKALTMTFNDQEMVIATEYLDEQSWFITIEETLDSQRSLFVAIISYSGLIFALLILIYFFTILSINNLIKKNLSSVSDNITSIANGDYGIQIQGYLFKDFEHITKGFNQMSESLKNSRNRLENLAYYDQLTNLRSRNYLKEEFSKMIQKYSKIFIIYLDIYRFKLINDLYGYEFGNRLLIQLANRLQNLPIRDAFPLKAESDGFIILVNGDDLDLHLESTVSYILSSVSRPYKIDNIEVELTINAGISVYPDHGKEPEELVNNSITALLEAKKSQTRLYEYYDVTRKDEFQRKIEIEASIDKAFKNDEFYPVFQPIMYADTEEIRGFEILSRWKHPSLGNISPVEFIPILEQSHKISILDRLVLKKGIEKVQELKEKLGKDFVISINLSIDTILMDDFVDYVKKTIKHSDFNPDFLELEMTESTIINDFKLVSQKVKQLRNIGVRFAEDDFGDGFSALNYLTSLDLNTVKISINITKTLLTNKNNQKLLKFIINLAKEFGFETVVEGVEDSETIKICKKYGCTYIQGFYYYKPMLFEELFKIIEKRNR